MAQGVKKPIGLGSTKSANAELEKEVSAKLASNDQLKFAKLSVTADVTKNQITLAGELPSDALRTTAVELAKSAQAGLLVNDQITVKTKVLPEESKGGGARTNR
jgi:osmotically-inducible protein OsmY